MNGVKPAEITKDQIELYKQHRGVAFKEALSRLLIEYDCELVPIATITPDGRIVTNITINVK